MQVSEVEWKEGDKLQERPENGGQALKKKKRRKVIWLHLPPWPTENMLLPSCNSAFSKFLPKSGGFAGMVP